MPPQKNSNKKPKTRPVHLNIELHDEVVDIARKRNEDIQDVARRAIRLGLPYMIPPKDIESTTTK